MNQKSQMQNLFWNETKQNILIARQFCYIYFDDSKAEEKSSDNTTKKSCKTFTNEQKRDVKHSHTKKKKHGNPQNLMLKKKTHMHINIYL